MPDPWYPGAQRLAGQNAGYRAGRITDLWGAVCHYTVGRNSSGTCGRDFQILTNRDGTVTQGAEVDAVNWGAGDPWNAHCVHIEVEYLPGFDDELWTPAQEDATGGVCDWLRDTWGVLPDFYDGPRIAFHRGFITHRSLLQTGDLHSDWWPHLPTAAAPAPRPKEDTVYIVKNRDNGLHTLYTGLGATANIDESFSNELAFAGVPRYEVPGTVAASVGLIHVAHRDDLVAAIAAKVPGGGAAAAPTSGTWTATP